MPALRAETHQTIDPEGEMKEGEEVIAIMESLSTMINTDDEFHAIQQLAQNLRSLVHMCQLNQKELQACLQGSRDKVKAKEQAILNAQKLNWKDEALEELKNNLAQARIEEEKARATARSVEEHLDALAEQLQSVEAQKQTLVSLAAEEVRLKNELSLFSTISSIIPDLSQTHVFAGTLLDKEDVKEFTLGYADMSAYQQSKTIWDMMC